MASCPSWRRSRKDAYHATEEGKRRSQVVTAVAIHCREEERRELERRYDGRRGDYRDRRDDRRGDRRRRYCSVCCIQK